MKIKIMYSVHIPKTAGTYFRDYLFHLPFDAVYFYYDGNEDMGLRLSRLPVSISTKQDGWLNKLNKNQDDENIQLINSVVIHGHYFAKTYLKDNNDNQFMTWVRDPVDRLLSHYSFWKNNSFPSDPNWINFNKRSMGIIEFSELKINQNIYFNYLEGLDLSKVFFIGVVDYMEESLKILEDKFKISTNFTKPKLNVTVNKFTDISNEQKDYILSLNKKDSEIYDFSLKAIGKY